MHPDNFEPKADGYLPGCNDNHKVSKSCLVWIVLLAFVVIPGSNGFLRFAYRPRCDFSRVLIGSLVRRFFEYLLVAPGTEVSLGSDLGGPSSSDGHPWPPWSHPIAGMRESMMSKSVGCLTWGGSGGDGMVVVFGGSLWLRW